MSNLTINEQFTAKAAELGYVLHIDGEGKVQHLWPADRNDYTPEIHGGAPNYWGTGEQEPWTIQTTSYGSLGSADIDKIMQGFMRAQLMVSYLKAWGF